MIASLARARRAPHTSRDSASTRASFAKGKTLCVESAFLMPCKKRPSKVTKEMFNGIPLTSNNRE